MKALKTYRDMQHALLIHKIKNSKQSNLKNLTLFTKCFRKNGL